VIYNRWSVVAVAFPFLEGTDSKRRPALVISSDRLAREQELYWIAMITTAKSGKRPDDVTITDHERAGLPEDCVIRAARIATVSETQIARKVGDITMKDRNAVLSLIRRYLP
jgi:mRNA interferase MazF